MYCSITVFYILEVSSAEVSETSGWDSSCGSSVECEAASQEFFEFAAAAAASSMMLFFFFMMVVMTVNLRS